MAERTDFLGTLMTTELPAEWRPAVSTCPFNGVERISAMSGKSGKSGCDLNELLDRVVAVALFRGTSGKLAERLGPGSWTSSLNHLRRCI